MQTNCRVLRYIDVASTEHRIRTGSGTPANIPICAAHAAAINDGARWVWLEEDGSFLLTADADMVFPRILRGYEARATAEAEIEKGRLEPVITLKMTYGFLGQSGDEELTINLSLRSARALSRSLERLAGLPPTGQ